MKKAILFDMDGVLVDSEPVINEAAILGLNEYGIKPEPEDFLPFVGTGEDRYIGGVAEKYGLAYKVEMKHRVYQIYLEIVDEKIEIFDGVHELLKFLKESNFKIALASSADIIKIEANLKAAGIDKSIFDAVVSGEDVVNKKPSPDIYLYAANKIGVTPENCVVVEDALNGIQAAKAAGMKCIAVATSFKNDELAKEKPNHICESIKGVRSALSEI